MALKGSYSDAFKRAAVMFGVGQYLYGCDAPWVEVDRGEQIKATEMPKFCAALRKMAAKEPAEAQPEPATQRRLKISERAVAGIDYRFDTKAPVVDDAIPDWNDVPFATGKDGSEAVRLQLMSSLRGMKAKPATSPSRPSSWNAGRSYGNAWAKATSVLRARSPQA
jgi:hypothetical protein